MPFSSKLLQMGAAGAGEKLYVEDVFSTYLYTGTGSNQTITNGIDLSGEGGLVWIKDRTTGNHHNLVDTVRGATKDLYSSLTSAQGTTTDGLTAFTSSGFTLGADAGGGDRVNKSSDNYASWTFRKAEKFFDVVTYTGTQNSSGTGQTVNHNLGSTPGCIIVKPITNTSGTGYSIADWIVYHRALSSPTTQYLKLNSTASIDGNSDKIRAVSDTTFTAGWEIGYTGIEYVAYVFAHDAGGFGDDGSDSVIKCDSFSYNDTSGNTISLGWEPQFVLVKNASSTVSWVIQDNMRGMTADNTGNRLFPNSSLAEDTSGYIGITADGFKVGASVFTNGNTIIYIAIRRGPMKTPTSGTSVFSPNTASSPQGTKITTNFPVDMQMMAWRGGDSDNSMTMDRLRGISTNATETSGLFLKTASTAAENTASPYRSRFWDNTGFQVPSWVENSSTVWWNFRRAPGFFDEVCYTGNGANRTISHNLGVVPELIIVKRREATGAWRVYAAPVGPTKFLGLNETAAATVASVAWDDTTPTSSVFSLGTGANLNASGGTYVAYLFATVAGVSKVGSYTGNGSNQTINCGFTAGARFVLIKRTDSTGDWVVFDSARGIVAGNDPYLLFNSTAAEVTDKDAVDTDNSGFVVNETTGPNVNTDAATYIFLAIA